MWGSKSVGITAGALFALFVAFPALAQDSGVLYWRFLGQSRVQDGGVIGSFELCGSEGLEQVAVFYTSFPFSYYRSADTGEAPPEPQVFCKEFPEGLEILELYSSRMAFIELWARGERDGTVLVAQTCITLFGEASTEGSAEGFSLIEDLPPLPRVSTYRFTELANPDADSLEGMGLRRTQAIRYAQMQSGEQGVFHLAGTGEVPASMAVYEGDALRDRVDSENGIFFYTIPEFPDLEKQGIFGWKDMFVAFETAGLTASFSMPIYRAIYGRTSLSGGIVLLCAAMALTLVFLLVSGHRYRRGLA